MSVKINSTKEEKLAALVDALHAAGLRVREIRIENSRPFMDTIDRNFKSSWEQSSVEIQLIAVTPEAHALAQIWALKGRY